MILRDRDADADTANGLEERVYVVQDANYNVTALIGDTNAESRGVQWGTIERFRYEPYGTRTVLNADFTPKTGNTSSVAFAAGHQGGTLDAVTGTYHFRNRDLNTEDMRWTRQDPAGYVDGGSLYLAYLSGPVMHVDAHGLQTTAPTTQPTTQPASTQPVTDDAGGTWCASALKEVRLNVVRPKRNPVADGIGNIIAGRPVEENILPGHTFLDVDGATAGFWPLGGWPNADGEIRSPDTKAGLETHYLVFKLCPDSLKKLQDAIAADQKNIAQLKYKLVDLFDDDNNYQCTTWAVEKLRDLGIKLPRALDPVTASDLPGMQPKQP